MGKGRSKGQGGAAPGPAFVAPAAGVQGDLRGALGAWFKGEQRDLPWRLTRDPYGIWVSEAMLQQTRVETVLDYWPRFLGRFPTIAALAEAEEEAVLEAWSGLGYYRRARSLQAAAKAIVADHGGVFPRDRDEVLSLPGVGPYTAGAVLSIAFDDPVPIVDGNVERVFSRLFLLDGVRTSGPLLRACWSAAETLIVDRTDDGVRPRDWNQGLMELGALVCKPTSPACDRCPVSQHCGAFRAGRQGELPRPKAKKPPIEVELEILVTESEGRWLLERRPPGGLMGGMWEFPTLEVVGPGLFPTELLPELRNGLEPGDELFPMTHGITRHRIRAKVRRAAATADIRGLSPAEPSGARWVPKGEAEALALTGMAKKVISGLERHARQSLLFEGG